MNRSGAGSPASRVRVETSFRRAPGVVLDLAERLYALIYLWIALKPHVYAGRTRLDPAIEIPVVTALDGDLDEPTVDGEIGLERAVRAPLRQFREHGLVDEIDVFHAVRLGYNPSAKRL